MKAKPRDNQLPASVLKNDLYTVLEQSSESFEVLVFKSIMSSEGAENETLESVGTIEHKESKLLYQGAIKCKAVELPLDMDMQGRAVSASGELWDGELEESTIMVFSDPAISEQSLILVNDLIDKKIVTQLYYVLDVHPLGKYGTTGVKHVLIPFRGDVSALLSSVDASDKEEYFGDLSEVF